MCFKILFYCFCLCIYESKCDRIYQDSKEQKRKIINYVFWLTKSHLKTHWRTDRFLWERGFFHLNMKCWKMTVARGKMLIKVSPGSGCVEKLSGAKLSEVWVHGCSLLALRFGSGKIASPSSSPISLPCLQQPDHEECRGNFTPFCSTACGHLPGSFGYLSLTNSVYFTIRCIVSTWQCSSFQNSKYF